MSSTTGAYDLLPAVHPLGCAELSIRGRRPTSFGTPIVTIDVHELWLPGRDPDGLDTARDGCFLAAASWHAQFPGAAADLRAERIDVDRGKRRDLRVHRHPFGQSNAVRVPAVLPSPEVWLESIDSLVLGWPGEDVDLLDDVDEADN